MYTPTYDKTKHINAHQIKINNFKRSIHPIKKYNIPYKNNIHLITLYQLNKKVETKLENKKIEKKLENKKVETKK